MPSQPTLFFVAIFFLESLADMLQNGFMAAILGREWAQGQVMPVGDMIVACLDASRLGLHGMSVMYSLLLILSTRYKVHYIRILWDFSNVLNFWQNALLSAFYCVKITSFSHPAFFWFRWRPSRSVPRLLLGSLVISVLTTIASVIRHTIAIQVVDSQVPYTNGSWADQAITFHQKFFLLYETLVLLVPFLLFLVSIPLLLLSLHQQLGQMQGGWPGPHDLSTQYWAWQAVTYAGISLHSTILLLNSPRFRRTPENGLHGCGSIGCGGLAGGQGPPESSDKEPGSG
ncbi:taste receptor type 2 member 134-like [Dugong dugon]